MNVEFGMSCFKGVCMMMGIVLIMVFLVEVMGMFLFMNVVLFVVDVCWMVLVYMIGKWIVEMVEEDLKFLDIFIKEVFENVIMINVVVGGFINVVVYLLVLVGCVGVDLSFKDFELGGEILLFVNCMFLGKYLMEDFCYVGGVFVVLKEFGDCLRLVMICLGGDILVYVDGVECYNDDVICMMENLLKFVVGLCVLCGNFVLNGVIVKFLVVMDVFLEYEVEVFVFESIEDLKVNIDNEDLLVMFDIILVLKGCGFKGYSGMLEVGNMLIPGKLVK